MCYTCSVGGQEFDQRTSETDQIQQRIRHSNTLMLTHIDLSRIRFSHGASRVLESALATNTLTKTLVLFGCSINAKWDLQHIGSMLLKNSTLTVVDLTGNSLRDLPLIPEVLSRNTALTNLGLGNCDISELGLNRLALALRVSSTLSVLDLSGNSIKTEKAKNLALALRVNTTLTELNLNSNTMGSDGGFALGSALEVNSTLKTLNLKLCHIGSRGALKIAEALDTNSALTTLDLSMNMMEDDVAARFGEMLTRNDSLTSLNLTNMKTKRAGLMALVAAFAVNTKLGVLELAYTSPCVRDLKEVVERFTERNKLIARDRVTLFSMLLPLLNDTSEFDVEADELPAKRQRVS